MNKIPIIFMGTPTFAVASLRALINYGLNVAAVVTAPSKPQGRGQRQIDPPVKILALQHNIPVLQPTHLKSSAFLRQLRHFNASLQVVVAFRMLPQVVWSMPVLGTFNLHASLLPQYRGAAPIHWAIINGEKETGVTTFFINEAVDTGDIICQERELITSDDDTGSLHDKLMKKGALLTLKTTLAILSGQPNTKKQSYIHTLKKAPKIFKAMCDIDWNQPGEKISLFVRGMRPKPTAHTTINGKFFKIWKVSATHKRHSSTKKIPFITDGNSYLSMKVSDGWVDIEELQPAGKQKMKAQEFLKGNKLNY